MPVFSRGKLVELISECRDEGNIDKQVEILREINSWLPESKRIALPSLITDDYVNRALDIAESAC
jgi:hypothetical protein